MNYQVNYNEHTDSRWAADLAHLPGFSPTHPGGPARKVEDVVAANGKYWVRAEVKGQAIGYSVLHGDRLLATTPYATEPKRIEEYRVWASRIAASLAWRDATLQWADEQFDMDMERLIKELLAEANKWSPTHSWGNERWSEDLTLADYQMEQHADLVGRTAHEP
ncbi:MAG: hypothetical protein FJZ89_09725 [Chloroflexi bacterium]|nr:hypothetical protein [Chloroflexota bacterium]